MNPRVTDNDKDEITVSLNGKELRGWSYSTDDERRRKMLLAREYVEGYCDGQRQPGPVGGGAMNDSDTQASIERGGRKIEERARALIARNGRNHENNNAGIPVGSQLHMIEVLIGELDKTRADLATHVDATTTTENRIIDAELAAQAAKTALRKFAIRDIPFPPTFARSPFTAVFCAACMEHWGTFYAHATEHHADDCPLKGTEQ